MPTRWRGIFYGTVFLLAVGTAAWTRYGAESAWWVGVVVGFLVFALVCFIGPRLLARHLTKRVDRAMSEITSAGPHFASDRNAGYELV
jgi:Kef-type K+ transport system membrane component KefB